MSIVEHSATIVGINDENITVDVNSRSACMSCHLKDNCGIFDCKSTIIEVTSPTPELYTLGQTIMVTIDEYHGWTAVFFGYILPLLLVLITLLSTIYFTQDETAAGIYSLTILIPYYLVLLLFKKNFSRRFNFKIKDNQPV